MRSRESGASEISGRDAFVHKRSSRRVDETARGREQNEREKEGSEKGRKKERKFQP